jgi:tripeptidyl-peptidase I
MWLDQFAIVLVGTLGVQAASGTLSQSAGVASREVPVSHALHERHLPHWGEQWSKRHRLPGTAVLPVRIGLRQSNLQEGHEKLMDMFVSALDVARSSSTDSYLHTAPTPDRQTMAST